MYALLGREPVTVTVRPVKAEFLDATVVPVLARYVEWHNTGDDTAPFSASLAAVKTERVTYALSAVQAIAELATVDVDIAIGDVGDISGEADFAFIKTWSVPTPDTREITVGPDATASADVPAHSTTTAYLWTGLCTAWFRVTYQARLEGMVIVVHTDGYTGHQLYGVSPGAIPKASGQPETVTVDYDHLVTHYGTTVVDVAPGAYDPNREAPKPTPAHAVRLTPPGTGPGPVGAR